MFREALGGRVSRSASSLSILPVRLPGVRVGIVVFCTDVDSDLKCDSRHYIAGRIVPTSGGAMIPGHPSLTQVVGRAENAFGALMRQVLASTGGTFHQWVCLSVLASAGGTLTGERLVERVTGALKIHRGSAARA